MGINEKIKEEIKDKILRKKNESYRKRKKGSKERKNLIIKTHIINESRRDSQLLGGYLKYI